MCAQQVAAWILLGIACCLHGSRLDPMSAQFTTVQWLGMCAKPRRAPCGTCFTSA
jgi:hypothetical protein